MFCHPVLLYTKEMGRFKSESELNFFPNFASKRETN